MPSVAALVSCVGGQGGQGLAGQGIVGHSETVGGGPVSLGKEVQYAGSVGQGRAVPHNSDCKK